MGFNIGSLVFSETIYLWMHLPMVTWQFGDNAHRLCGETRYQMDSIYRLKTQDNRTHSSISNLQTSILNVFDLLNMESHPRELKYQTAEMPLSDSLTPSSFQPKLCLMKAYASTLGGSFLQQEDFREPVASPSDTHHHITLSAPFTKRTMWTVFSSNKIR